MGALRGREAPGDCFQSEIVWSRHILDPSHPKKAMKLKASILKLPLAKVTPGSARKLQPLTYLLKCLSLIDSTSSMLMSVMLEKL